MFLWLLIWRFQVIDLCTTMIVSVLSQLTWVFYHKIGHHYGGSLHFSTSWQMLFLSFPINKFKHRPKTEFISIYRFNKDTCCCVEFCIVLPGRWLSQNYRCGGRIQSYLHLTAGYNRAENWQWTQLQQCTLCHHQYRCLLQLWCRYLKPTQPQRIYRHSAIPI